MEEGMVGRGNRPAVESYSVGRAMRIENVLVVVGEPSRTEAPLSAAIELADRENARLTIAKTCDVRDAYVWVTPFGSGAAYVNPQAETPEQACRAVALLARSVPRWMPVTTLVLDQSTDKRLVKLISDGHFGAVVAESGLFTRCKRLRRLLALQDVLAVPVAIDQAGVTRCDARAQGDPDAAGAATPSSPPVGYVSPGTPVPIR